MEHLTVFLALVVAAVVSLGVLFFSFKLLRKTQQQEKLERRNQTAEYQLHPKIQKEMQQREHKQRDEI